jgi:WhiB family redox-sensing transcriptional regulator
VTLGHFSSEYLQLLSSIYKAGGVACEDYPDLFFPEDIPNPEYRQAATISAKFLCNGCEIKVKCFEYALESNQKHGIWGGTLPSERI